MNDFSSSSVRRILKRVAILKEEKLNYESEPIGCIRTSYKDKRKGSDETRSMECVNNVVEGGRVVVVVSFFDKEKEEDEKKKRKKKRKPFVHGGLFIVIKFIIESI